MESSLSLWHIAELIRRNPSERRLKSAGKAGLYLAMALAAAGVLLGGRADSARQTRDVTALLLSLPVGQALVAVTGLAIVGAGVFHVVKGLRRRFARDLAGQPGPALTAVGVAGFVAKGLALAVVGALFCQAALTHDPSQSTGIDGALETLLRVPAGPAIVAAVGAGFAAYGVYSFARARYAKT